MILVSERIKHLSGKIQTLLADLEYRRENVSDTLSKKYENAIFERALRNCKKKGVKFNGFALTESSLRVFIYYLLKEKKTHYSLIELGGGQSTIFLDVLSNYVPVQTITFEHDITWVRDLKSMIRSEDGITSVSLKQIDSKNRDTMFADPRNSYAVWKKLSLEVPQESYRDLHMEDCFYDIALEQIAGLSLDGLIVDGPHGNGRSICFPLFRGIIKKNTLILIDDYHHYPFMSDLGRIYKYEIIEKRKYRYSNKGWVIVKIVD